MSKRKTIRVQKYWMVDHDTDLDA